MNRSRPGLVSLVSLITLLAAGPMWVGRAQAANEEEARVYLDKATAAYALNKYAVAAENFEKAFELKPDPALLYNAAQSYRLAGNKERALALYESYLRVYGGADKRGQVEARIKDLKQAIANDKAVANSPPFTTMPVGGTGGKATQPAPAPTAPPAPAAAPPPAPAATAPPPAPADPAPVQPVTVAVATAPPPAATPPADTSGSSGSNPTLLTQSASSPSGDDSLTKKPWFWVAVGGGVAAAALVVVLLAAGGSEAAMPTIGRARGN
jgi:hypothetical protein